MKKLTLNNSILVTQFTTFPLTISLQDKFNAFLNNYPISTNHNAFNHSHSYTQLNANIQHTRNKNLPPSQKHSKPTQHLTSVMEEKQLKNNQISHQIGNGQDDVGVAIEKQVDFLTQIDNTVLRRTNIMWESKKNITFGIKLGNKGMKKEGQDFEPEEQYRKLLKRFRTKVQKQVQDIKFTIAKEHLVNKQIKQAQKSGRNKFYLLKANKNALNDAQSISESENYIPEMFNQVLKNKFSVKKQEIGQKFLSTVNKERVKKILIMGTNRLRSKKLNQQKYQGVMMSLPSIPKD